MAYKHAKKKKKKGCFSRFLLFLLCISIATTALYFGTDLLSKSEKKLMKSFYPIKYERYVKKASEKYNLEQALIYAVIKTESDFDPNAVSNVGAIGLMQMMPESFQWVQDLRDESYKESDLYTPEINIDYGCYLLDYFYDYYGNEQCAVAAYNAGFVVSDWLKDSEHSTDGKTLTSIPYAQTSIYVEKVAKAKEMYNKLYFTKE